MSVISLETPREQDVRIWCWCWCLKDTYKLGLVVLPLTPARIAGAERVVLFIPKLRKADMRESECFTLF